MRCIAQSECAEWLEARHIRIPSPNRLADATGTCEIVFQTPAEARTQRLLARDLIAWLGNFESALLWLTEWPFRKADEMAMIAALRRGHGERRPLDASPAHLFNFTEKEELTAWIYVVMSFSWSASLFPSPFQGSVIRATHEEFVALSTPDAARFADARSFVRRYDVDIYRED